MMISNLLALALAAAAPSDQASRFRPLPAAEPKPTTGTDAVRPSKSPGARPLPFAGGRTFTTLDDYLAFRRARGAIDLPWYEEVEPGVFVLRTRLRPPSTPQRFTRAELARRFGFAHP